MELNKSDIYLYNSYNQYNSYDDKYFHHKTNNNVECIDLSDLFPYVYNQYIQHNNIIGKGITSTCAIASLMSFLYKKIYKVAWTRIL